MPEASHPGDRTPAERDRDHASLARLSDTLVPALVQKLNASGLGELEVREGDWRIRLRRPATASAAVPARRADRARAASHVPDREARAPREAGLAPDPGPARASGGTPLDERRAFATSPAVGIFRVEAQPGTHVLAGDRVGLVDLLGIPQDVVAPIDGTVAELLATPGEAVEYGEPVMVVEADPPLDATDDPAGEG